MVGSQLDFQKSPSSCLFITHWTKNFPYLIDANQVRQLTMTSSLAQRPRGLKHRSLLCSLSFSTLKIMKSRAQSVLPDTNTANGFLPRNIRTLHIQVMGNNSSLNLNNNTSHSCEKSFFWKHKYKVKDVLSIVIQI